MGDDPLSDTAWERITISFYAGFELLDTVLS